MINPYFIYAISFLCVLMAYCLNWSSLYSDLSGMLLTFLLITILIAFLLGRNMMKMNGIQFYYVRVRKEYNVVTYLILLGYCLEFIYHGNFPLLGIFIGHPLSYHEFGIPTFHVLLVTFNSFFAIFLFHVFISNSKYKGKIFILFLLNLLPGILILNRGMLVIILINCVFVYLIKYQWQITAQKIALLVMVGLLAMYGFGVVGNIRVNNDYKTNTSLLDNTLFMEIGVATDNFKTSLVPKEYFWAYIYISSPLANLQKTINEFEHKRDIEWFDSFSFASTQLIPDFVGKRVTSVYEINNPAPLKITPELNVSTAFAKPFVILGWPGMSLYIMFSFVFAFLYLLLLKRLNSEYFVVGVALINSIFVFNTFNNMFAFTGLSFQLVYPVLFSIIQKWKSNQEVVKYERNIGNRTL